VRSSSSGCWQWEPSACCPARTSRRRQCGRCTAAGTCSSRPCCRWPGLPGSDEYDKAESPCGWAHPTAAHWHTTAPAEALRPRSSWEFARPRRWVHIPPRIVSVTTARLSSRFRVVLRTSLGFAGLGIGSSVCGAAVSGLMLTLQGLPGVFGQHGYALLVSSLSYVAAALLVGSVWTGLLQRRTVVWFLLGRPPSYDEARRALRLPIDTAVVSGTLWLLGTVLLGTLSVAFGSGWDAIGVTMTIGIGGLFIVRMKYLDAACYSRAMC